jgi:zinc protease
MSYFLFCSLLVLFSTASWAADRQKPAERPKSQKGNKAFPFPYKQEDLANGLRLITVPTGFPNLASLFIVVQTGSRNEVEPGKSGFAHLFEHIMFRGTEKFPPEKYTELLKEAGAASNAFTGDDLTVYHTTFSKEDLPNILMMEADRFQNLKYSQDVFRTEALAVLGEYSKNAADPSNKLEEVMRDTAFTNHTYKHTAMGFLKDVQDMPNQYDYSLQFFDRYYRPEYTTMIVAGDVRADEVRPAVEKFWAAWKPGTFKAEIPAEPPQDGPRTAKVDWASPTLPWVVVAFKNPAYSDTEKDTAALNLLASLAFSETSELYQKLVIQEQKIDVLAGENEYHVDPYLFTIAARLKNPADLDYVREEILRTLKDAAEKPVPTERFDAVRSNLRYAFSLRLDNSEAIAEAVARAVALRRTPETINREYELYSQVTPADVQRVARDYLGEKGRTIVTLTGPPSGGAQ